MALTVKELKRICDLISKKVTKEEIKQYLKKKEEEEEGECQTS